MRAPVLVIHICAGTLGLLSGAAAMALRKGSRRHGAAGNVFVVAMLVMGCDRGVSGQCFRRRFRVIPGDHGVADRQKARRANDHL